MSGTPLLSLAIWVPILAGFVVLATGSDRNAPLARMLSLIGALAGLLVTIPLYTGFDMQTAGDAVRRAEDLDSAFQRQLPSRC
jgi:NADH-quinone oxidoreductase subunit M